LSDEECKIALSRSLLSGCSHQLRRALVFPQLVAGFFSAEFECAGTSGKACLRYEGAG
jgi:hypothetical protein